jgi:DNA-binding XRE family transcriptional regulator
VGRNDTDPRHVFGSALRHLRTQAGMSQEQLGRAAFISGDMLSKIERGERAATAKVVEACESVPELGSNGMLTLRGISSVCLARRSLAGLPHGPSLSLRLSG